MREHEYGEGDGHGRKGNLGAGGTSNVAIMISTTNVPSIAGLASVGHL